MIGRRSFLKFLGLAPVAAQLPAPVAPYASIFDGECWAPDARTLAKCYNFGYPGGLKMTAPIAPPRRQDLVFVKGWFPSYE